MTKPTPIADAVRAAEAARQEEERAAQAEAEAAAEAERQAQAEAAQLDEDAASIRNAFKRGGMKMALAVGRTYGWHDGDIEELFKVRPAKEDVGPRDEREDDGGGDGGEPPPPDDGGSYEDDDKRRRFLLKKKPIRPVPADCPVRPLGTLGGKYFYLDPASQFRELDVSDHNANGLRALFGTEAAYLWNTWPKWREPKNADDMPRHINFKPDEATESLMVASARRGLFDPHTRIRGRGGWRGEDGELVLHLGDALLCGGELGPPREYGRHIYPAGNPCPRPAAEAAPALVDTLLTYFDGWEWAGRWAHRDGLRHRLASTLLTGWIGCGMAGAALDWRPLVWMTGDAGTGKSTLQKAISQLLDGFLIEATDASGPSIWQALKYDALPVALDEMENDAESPRNRNIIKLARAAASGGRIMRGSAGGEASYFTAHSAFAFSSIIIPPMLGQDVQRFCILELEPLPADRKLKRLEGSELRAIGAAMLRALVDGWGRWQDTFDAYAAPLIDRGHNQRGADVWATLLAMADLMAGPERADNDSIAMICDLLRPEKRDDTVNSFSMLNHLSTKPLDVFRGGTRMTIGELVTVAADISVLKDSPATPSSAAEALRSWSIFVEPDKDGMRVTLPNQSSGLLKLFEGSQWGGMPGAAGGWAQGMKRLPGAQQENSRKLGGRGWSVPAHVFLQLEDGT